MTLSINQLSIPLYQGNFIQTLTATFSKGDLVAIIGESGIGKTTLLNCLSGLQPPQKGSIYLNQENIFSLSYPQRAQKIFSLSSIDKAEDDRIVESQIGTAFFPKKGKNFLLTPQALQKIDEACELLRISHLKGKKLKHLSTGERKRVNLARSLIDEEIELYLLDEPFSGIDIKHQIHIADLLKYLQRQKKIVFFSLHDINLLFKLPNYVIGIDYKREIIHGKSEKIDSCFLQKIFNIQSKDWFF